MSKLFLQAEGGSRGVLGKAKRGDTQVVLGGGGEEGRLFSTKVELGRLWNERYSRRGFGYGSMERREHIYSIQIYSIDSAGIWVHLYMGKCGDS